MATKVLRFIPVGMARYRVFNATVENRNVVPKNGAVVIVANHPTVLDPVALWGALRRPAAILAKAELWRTPAAPLLRLLGMIKVHRGDATSRAGAWKLAEIVLRRGGVIVIFPEAGLSPSGKTVGEFRTGAARLALETGAVCVPVALVGMDDVLPRTTKKLNRGQPYKVVFGRPLDLSKYAGPDAAVRLTTDARLQVQQMLDAT